MEMVCAVGNRATERERQGKGSAQVKAKTAAKTRAKTKIQDFARIGVVTYTAYPGLMTGEITMADVVRAIGADEYFDTVEVTWINNADARTEAIKAADEFSMSVVFAAQPYLLARKLNLSAQDERSRKEAVKICRQAIDQARAWDASAFVVLSGPDPGPEKRAAGADALLRSLSELCRYAAGKTGTIPVLLETCDRGGFGKNQLNQLVGPTVEAVEIARRIRSKHENFGLLLNLAHLPLLKEFPAQAVELAKDFLGGVHIGNCVISNPNHPAFGNTYPPLGIPEGEIGRPQMTEFIGELLRVGFLDEGNVRLGQVSFDVAPVAPQTSADVIEQTKEMLDGAFASVRTRDEDNSSEPQES